MSKFSDDFMTFDCQLQAQRLETLGTLASGIAHDLNNQLTVILNNLALAMAAGAPGRTVDGCLADAHRAAERCVEMTRGMLAFGRRVSPVLAPLNLGRVIEETGRLLARIIPASIQVRLSIEPHLPAVLADATQIQQVLMNLAVNSRDAMPTGGRLDIRVENRGRWVVLVVADTGCGIAPEARGRIFEAFFTTKTTGGGTGLGLATVERIVRAHRGVIEFDSRPAQGTTFRVLLPVLRKDDEIRLVA